MQVTAAVCAICVGLLPTWSAAQDNKGQGQDGEIRYKANVVRSSDFVSKMEAPYFVATRKKKAYMRRGPSRKYAIIHVYLRKSTPLRVIGKDGHWRFVRDWDGVEGWMHVQLLRRSDDVMFRPANGLHAMLFTPFGTSPVKAIVEPMLIATLLGCEGKWCKVGAKNLEGWVLREQLWGVSEDMSAEN